MVDFRYVFCMFIQFGKPDNIPAISHSMDNLNAGLESFRNPTLRAPSKRILKMAAIMKKVDRITNFLAHFRTDRPCIILLRLEPYK